MACVPRASIMARATQGWCRSRRCRQNPRRYGSSRRVVLRRRIRVDAVVRHEQYETLDLGNFHWIVLSVFYSCRRRIRPSGAAGQFLERMVAAYAQAFGGLAPRRPLLFGRRRRSARRSARHRRSPIAAAPSPYRAPARGAGWASAASARLRAGCACRGGTAWRKSGRAGRSP